MSSVYQSAPSPATNRKPPKLLDQLKSALRVKHYAYRTEQAYVQWVRRFILYHGKRHPREMGAPEIEAFLTHLAVTGRVAASTQTQALSAILFLYKHVLRIDLPLLDAVRGCRKTSPSVRCATLGWGVQRLWRR